MMFGKVRLSNITRREIECSASRERGRSSDNRFLYNRAAGTPSNGDVMLACGSYIRANYLTPGIYWIVSRYLRDARVLSVSRLARLLRPLWLLTGLDSFPAEAHRCGGALAISVHGGRLRYGGRQGSPNKPSHRGRSHEQGLLAARTRVAPTQLPASDTILARVRTRKAYGLGLHLQSTRVGSLCGGFPKRMSTLSENARR
jgi:hypothetical protein